MFDMSPTTALSLLVEWPLLVVLFLYPTYVLLMAGALRMIGVRRAEVAKWALKQADRQRLADLLRAARGLPVETSPPRNPPGGG
jgi:hypothetical protein